MMKKPMTVLERGRGECMQLVRALAQLDCGMLRGSIRRGYVRKTAMILKTSTTPMGGLNGRRTKAGVKKTLIQRSDHPADTSMTDTILLVLWLPSSQSAIRRAANNNSRQATDAGKGTARWRRRVSTPKHAARVTRIPPGTRIHERNRLS
jgi:hypothetical protein